MLALATRIRTAAPAQRVLAAVVSTGMAGALVLTGSAPAAAEETRPTLELGDKSGYVLTVQKRLRVEPATGYFGSITQAAVKKFQATHAIPTLGIVGPRTWAALDTLSYTTVKPVTTYRISATFGASGSNWSRTHTGLDFAAPTGTPVRSLQSGTVTAAGWNTAYGWRMKVRHADGTSTWYCHLSKMYKGVGIKVAAGTTIGAVGSTGNSTGPHLHLEVRNAANVPLNPRTWMAYRGVFV